MAWILININPKRPIIGIGSARQLAGFNGLPERASAGSRYDRHCMLP